MARKKSDTKVKKKKKIWVKILAPEIFGNKEIGETLVSEPEDALDRVVEVYLFNLTMNVKHQEGKMIFKIVEVRGDEALTKVIGYEMINAFVKRIVKKRTDRIDVSEVFMTKDKEVLRIKPLIITASNTSYSVRKAIRHLVSEFLRKKLESLTYEGFLKEFISGKFERELFDEVSKIYPVKYAKIRKFELLEGLEKEKFLRIFETLYGNNK
jgi:small subunit ribosomal protein S3Ae